MLYTTVKAEILEVDWSPKEKWAQAESWYFVQVDDNVSLEMYIWSMSLAGITSAFE